MTLALALSGIGMIANFGICVYELIEGKLSVIPLVEGILFTIIFFAI